MIYPATIPTESGTRGQMADLLLHPSRDESPTQPKRHQYDKTSLVGTQLNTHVTKRKLPDIDEVIEHEEFGPPRTKRMLSIRQYRTYRITDGESMHKLDPYSHDRNATLPFSTESAFITLGDSASEGALSDTLRSTAFGFPLPTEA